MFIITVYRGWSEPTVLGYCESKKRALKIVERFNAWVSQVRALVKHASNPFNTYPSDITTIPPVWDALLCGDDHPAPYISETGRYSDSTLTVWSELQACMHEVKVIKTYKPTKKAKATHA